VLDAEGWDHDPLLLFTLILAHGQARAVVRHGEAVIAPSLRGLQRLLAEPPSTETP
jgi:hypothetical protein